MSVNCDASSSGRNNSKPLRPRAGTHSRVSAVTAKATRAPWRTNKLPNVRQRMTCPPPIDGLALAKNVIFMLSCRHCFDLSAIQNDLNL